MKKELPVFSAWLEVTGVILERAGRFPKSLRPTIGNRLIDRALEVLEHLVVLRYTRDREPAFRATNLTLEKIRLLVRVSFERRLLSGKQYAALAADIDACGRMLGGWRRTHQKQERTQR